LRDILPGYAELAGDVHRRVATTSVPAKIARSYRPAASTSRGDNKTCKLFLEWQARKSIKVFPKTAQIVRDLFRVTWVTLPANHAIDQTPERVCATINGAKEWTESRIIGPDGDATELLE
jgi:hypothetical protein